MELKYQMYRISFTNTYSVGSDLRLDCFVYGPSTDFNNIVPQIPRMPGAQISPPGSDKITEVTLLSNHYTLRTAQAAARKACNKNTKGGLGLPGVYRTNRAVSSEEFIPVLGGIRLGD